MKVIDHFSAKFLRGGFDLKPEDEEFDVKFAEQLGTRLARSGAKPAVVLKQADRQIGRALAAASNDLAICRVVTSETELETRKFQSLYTRKQHAKLDRKTQCLRMHTPTESPEFVMKMAHGAHAEMINNLFSKLPSPSSAEAKARQKSLYSVLNERHQSLHDHFDNLRVRLRHKTD